jgi:hypothetical protein
VSAYRAAIDHTTKTIETRARYFRNLVVAVVALTLISILWAAVTRTIWPLASLLFVLPVCGLFFLLDARHLDAWRSQLLDAWIKKEIDFRALHEAVTAVPMLPKGTVRGMLSTLPTAGDLVTEQRISSSTREGVAAAVAGVHAGQSDTLALKTAAAAIVSGSLVIAAALRRWEPLLGSLAVAFLPILGKWLRRRRIEVVKRRMFAAQARPDFSNAKYEELVALLRWDPISMTENAQQRAQQERLRRL